MQTRKMLTFAVAVRKLTAAWSSLRCLQIAKHRTIQSYRDQSALLRIKAKPEAESHSYIDERPLT